MNRGQLERAGVLLLALGGLVWSCGGGGGATLVAGPRRIMLNELAYTVILPTYDQLVVDAGELAAALTTLEAVPSQATLAAAQHAWRHARATWKQSEAFAIGPAESLNSVAKIDFTPIRTERIESAIRGATEFDSDQIENLGANVKGFLALEYLLFDASGDDAAILAQLGDPPRRSYARALAENLRDQATHLRDAWAPDSGNFAQQLVAAGQGSTAFPTVKAAVDKVVNQIIFLSEDIADAQLLAALGRNDGPPQPDAIEAHRSENGLADLLDDLTGIQNVYFGTYAGRQGGGFSRVVNEISPDTEGAIALSIQRSMETAARISQPLEEAVANEPDLVERAQVRAKELMRRLEIDLVTVLGTTLRFNPSDGD